jgi:ketosteroid isomerase-like protein
MQLEELIRRAYAAFNARDIDAALATMSANVIWPNGMDGGTVHGREGIREYWTRLWQLTDPRVEPISIHQDASGAYAVKVHQVVKDLNGAVMIDRVVRQTYRIRDGLIESMNISE